MKYFDKDRVRGILIEQIKKKHMIVSLTSYFIGLMHLNTRKLWGKSLYMTVVTTKFQV